ncbi:cobalamin biosynthesis protein CbiL [Desulfovibrio sp. OttesenSCG-928-C14]|nr:cobalamin biosynthesis protein CbiL [Desulfovibrio sp. OttesenSCG-928-C14]
MRKYWITSLAALVLLLCLAGAALAHKVNVFAYVDGEAIQVEGYFTRSQKVRHGKVSVSDLATSQKLLEGTTDEQGLFRFRPDQDFLKTGHGLSILLNAGEGHQSSWEIPAEELANLAPSGAPLPPAQAAPLESAPAISAAELEAIINKALDAKLAPVKQALARQAESGPGLRDIIGGLGWILGLLGLAAYMKYKR